MMELVSQVNTEEQGNGKVIEKKAFGKPIAQELPREITQECANVTKYMAELSKEALGRIRDIEATARMSELKSGSIIVK